MKNTLSVLALLFSANLLADCGEMSLPPQGLSELGLTSEQLKELDAEMIGYRSETDHYVNCIDAKVKTFDTREEAYESAFRSHMALIDHLQKIRALADDRFGFHVDNALFVEDPNQAQPDQGETLEEQPVDGGEPLEGQPLEGRLESEMESSAPTQADGLVQPENEVEGSDG